VLTLFLLLFNSQLLLIAFYYHHTSEPLDVHERRTQGFHCDHSLAGQLCLPHHSSVGPWYLGGRVAKAGGWGPTQSVVPRLLDVIPTPTKILSSTFVIRPVVLVVAGDCSAFRFSCTFFHNFKTSSNCCLQLTPGKPLLLSDPSSIHSPVVFGAQLGQLVLGSTLTILEQLFFGFSYPGSVVFHSLSYVGSGCYWGCFSAVFGFIGCFSFSHVRSLAVVI